VRPLNGTRQAAGCTLVRTFACESRPTLKDCRSSGGKLAPITGTASSAKANPKSARSAPLLLKALHLALIRQGRPHSMGPATGGPISNQSIHQQEPPLHRTVSGAAGRHNESACHSASTFGLQPMIRQRWPPALLHSSRAPFEAIALLAKFQVLPWPPTP
jgi:hypothetical protein